MNEYKTELHAHTAETSNCGKASASDLIEAYVKEGYTTVVITDHLSTHTYFKYDYKKMKWDEKVDVLLKGYNAALKASDGRINVILGMELRFDTNTEENDYLVYGITEKFLRKHKDLLDMNIKSFSKLAHKNDLLVFQAHPFRTNMKVTNPEYLDGVEIHNGCVRHNSRNEIAEHWATLNKLKMSSGSDYHQIGDEAQGGIITDFEIKTTEDLLNTLNNGNYKIIK